MKSFYRYLPLGDDTRARSLYVVAGGYTLIPPHTPYPPLPHPTDHHFLWRQGRTLQEYQIIYLTRGGGVFEAKSSGPRRLRAGSLFMLFPGEWHRYSPDPESGWDEHWVAFRGPLADRFVAECPLSPEEPVLDTGVQDVLLKEFLQVTEEIREASVGHQGIASARTLLILALAAASNPRQNFAGTEILSVIERAKCLMLEQMDQPLRMEPLAASLGVGYSWFRRMFRQYTGLSPAQYHLQARINYACDLLRTTVIPVAVVGQRTGFESAYHFSRLFREKTGASPSEYRAMIQTASSTGYTERQKPSSPSR